MAAQPDLHDFIARSDARLTQLGDPLRFVGYDLSRLGMRIDGVAKLPTLFEIQDVLATVKALAGTVVRTAPIGISGQPGRPDAASLANLDLVLKTARDMGLKVVIPFADSPESCATAAPGPVCTALHGRGLSDPHAFFADPGVRSDFLAEVNIVLQHVNTLSGIAYQNDPTIMAWENCVACGGTADPAAVSSWAEQLGQAIKSADPHHLYESGAFAGRIAPGEPNVSPGEPNTVPPALYATASVDIVGDILATRPDPAAARLLLNGVAEAVAATNRAYVLDSTGWAPSMWKTVAELDDWATYMARQRDLTGAIIIGLEGHATEGGYLPAPAALPKLGAAPLYFPGIRTQEMELAEAQARGRALRRFGYAMLDVVMLPAFLLPPKPEIIGAAHGHVVWRGSAGAWTYTVERSPDPSTPGSWQVVCDACATDLSGGWQDPALPAGPAWYRVMPHNINGHKSVPSEPVQATR